MTENLDYKDFLKKAKKVSKEINSSKTKYKSTLDKLKEEKKTLQKSSELILRKFDSLSVEAVLEKYPPNAQGSVFFYNLIMAKNELFDIDHFNKIARFFSYTEHVENKYESLYKTSTKEYFRDPYHPSIESLYETHEMLVNIYRLLFVLINEVDRDKILYHKVYNHLEDNGVFLTQSEKTELKYMSEISNKLSKVVSQLDDLFKAIKETNNLLQISIHSINTLSDNIDYVSSEMDTIGYNIEDMQSEIWGLNKN